jgi:hypothetical protein
MDSAIQNLSEESHDLRERFDRLAQDLEIAAANLRNPGRLPSSVLDAALAGMRADFASVVQLADVIAGRLGVSTNRESLESLQQIDNLVLEIERNQGSKLIAMAREMLNEIIRLRHRDGRLQNEIQKIAKAAQDLLNRLAGAVESQTLEVAEDLVKAHHPLSALLKLAKEHQVLDEGEQIPLADLVKGELGTGVMLAAVQGHLLPSSAVAPSDFKLPQAEPKAGKKVAEAASVDLSPVSESSLDLNLVENAARSTVDKRPPVAADEATEPPILPEIARWAEPVVYCKSDADPTPIVANHSTPAVVAATGEESTVTDKVSPLPESRQSEPLPDELASLEAFSDRYYINSRGQVVPAWWREDRAEFAARVGAALPQELQNRRLNRVWIFCAALEAMGEVPPWSSMDVAAIAALEVEPGAASAGADPMRLERLKEPESGRNCVDLRLPLFLEALRPASAFPLDYQSIDTLIDSARFQNSDLREFVRKSLKVHSGGRSAIELLRDRVEDRPERSPQDLASRLAAERKKFRDEIAHLWSAAGGKISQTHSREAWNRFMQKIEPTVKVLYPQPQGDERWNVVEMEQRVANIEDMHKRIADLGDVKKGDRSRADNAAAHIAKLAMDINHWMREWQNSQHRPTRQVEPLLPDAETRNLLSSTVERHDDPLEAFCVRILRSSFQDSKVIGEVAAVGGLMFQLQDYLSCPDLLGVMAAGSVDCTSSDSPPPRGHVRQLEEPVRAAAYLLESAKSPAAGSFQMLVHHLRERRRFDLLESVYSMLPLTDQDAVRRASREHSQTTSRLLTELHKRWRYLCDLASPAASSLEKTYKDAAQICSEKLADPISPHLLLEWLRRLCDHGDQQVRINVERLRQRAQTVQDDERRRVILGHIQQEQFADALWSLGETPQQAQRWRRETPWRTSASETFCDPLETMRRHEKALDYAQELIQHWRSGYQGGNQTIDRPLRTKFAHMMFSTGQRERSESPSGSNDNDAFRVPCNAIVDWFAQQNLNPCFLPQLRRFAKLVILTPLARVDSPSLSGTTSESRRRRKGQSVRDSRPAIDASGPRGVSGRVPRFKSFRRYDRRPRLVPIAQPRWPPNQLGCRVTGTRL